MTMFRWSSSALKRYGPGHIIIAAPDVETARSIARANFEAFLRHTNEWLFKSDGSIEEHLEDEHAEYHARFEADIAAAPTIETFIFIQGTE